MNVKKKNHVSVSWVENMTGHDRLWWVAKIQGLIVKHSKSTRDPWHKQTYTIRVISDLVQEIIKTWPKKEQFDGNMRMAAVLSYVLALWYVRVHRAKCYDPRRPVRLRQQAYESRQKYKEAIFSAMTYEGLDPQMFPGQKWESPFDPYPTDGYFV